MCLIRQVEWLQTKLTDMKNDRDMDNMIAHNLGVDVTGTAKSKRTGTSRYLELDGNRFVHCTVSGLPDGSLYTCKIKDCPAAIHKENKRLILKEMHNHNYNWANKPKKAV